LGWSWYSGPRLCAEKHRNSPGRAGRIATYSSQKCTRRNGWGGPPGPRGTPRPAAEPNEISLLKCEQADQGAGMPPGPGPGVRTTNCADVGWPGKHMALCGTACSTGAKSAGENQPLCGRMQQQCGSGACGMPDAGR
jgi:hypothetical protein